MTAMAVQTPSLLTADMNANCTTYFTTPLPRPEYGITREFLSLGFKLNLNSSRWTTDVHTVYYLVSRIFMAICWADIIVTYSHIHYW